MADARIPKNARRLSASLIDKWPRLINRIQYIESDIDDVKILPDDLVMSVHACGQLTDQVIALAVKAGAKVAVLPCCHHIASSDTNGLEGWIDGPLAVDVTRAAKLRAAGYTVLTRTIPDDITPKNRLLMGHFVDCCIKD